MDIDDVTRKLQLSVDLAKEWGEAKVLDGRKLSSVFTYDSVSFWDIAVVIVALYFVPRAISSDKRTPFFLNRAINLLKRGKSEIINRKYYLGKTKCHDWPTDPVFLFLGFQPYIYYDTIWPIVKNMANDQRARSVTLYDYLLLKGRCQETKDSKFQSIWEYWDNDLAAQVNRLTHLLKKDVKELKSMKILPQIIQNQGKSLWPQMENIFDWLFTVNLPYLMKHFVIAKHILESHRPEVIISPDVSEPRNRIYCLLGRHLKIPTLEVQFGLYGQEAAEWQFFAADRVAVWGQRSKHTLMLHGVPEEKIVLSGSPRHDSMIAISNSEVLQTRSMLGIPDGAVMIVFASSYMNVYDQIEDPFLLDLIKRVIFKAVDQTKGIYLVVKPHPNEKVNLTKKLAHGYRNILFVNKNEDIKTLIRACDVFMSLGSTATMDALIANKLIICPNFPGWIWNYLFVNSEAILSPQSYDEFLQCLSQTKEDDRKKILTSLEPARQRFLQEWLFKQDDQSSNRIKSLLFEMAKIPPAL